MSRIEDLGDSLDPYEPHDEHQPTTGLQDALDLYNEPQFIIIEAASPELRTIIKAAKRWATLLDTIRTELPCSCGDAWTERGLVDERCHYHAVIDALDLEVDE